MYCSFCRRPSAKLFSRLGEEECGFGMPVFEVVSAISPLFLVPNNAPFSPSNKALDPFVARPAQPHSNSFRRSFQAPMVVIPFLRLPLWADPSFLSSSTICSICTQISACFFVFLLHLFGFSISRWQQQRERSSPSCTDHARWFPHGSSSVALSSLGISATSFFDREVCSAATCTGFGRPTHSI